MPPVLQSTDAGAPNFLYGMSPDDFLSDTGNCFKVDNPSHKKFGTLNFIGSPVCEFIDSWGVIGNVRELSNISLEIIFPGCSLAWSIHFAIFPHVFVKLLISD